MYPISVGRPEGWAAPPTPRMNSERSIPRAAEPPDAAAGGAPQPPAADPQEALETARRAVDDIQREAQSTRAGAETPADAPPAFDLPEFDDRSVDHPVSGIDLLSKVNLNVRIELGRTRMLVEDVLRLNEGSVVELDKLAGDPVDVYVNDRHVACGEVLVLNDTFCVRISEIFSRSDEGGEN